MTMTTSAASDVGRAAATVHARSSCCRCRGCAHALWCVVDVAVSTAVESDGWRQVADRARRVGRMLRLGEALYSVARDVGAGMALLVACQQVGADEALAAAIDVAGEDFFRGVCTVRTRDIKI